MTTELNRFYEHLRRIYTYGCISALLDWDQKVSMPPESGAGRAAQLEQMSTLIHEHNTDPRFLDLVDSLHANSSQYQGSDAVNIREMKRQLDRARKLPVEFVARRSKLSNETYQIWGDARGRNDWAAVRPHLEQLMALCREEAELLGYENHPYDALLENYEPGGRISEIKPLLLRLGEALSKLIPTITAQFKDVGQPSGEYPEEIQRKMSLELAQACGFDLRRGRLDPTHHPFQTSLGPRDFRITTRFHPKNYLSSIYPTLHEVGHALYEAGLLEKYAGTPAGSPVSLGIHESQSRLWENLIGRSREYCVFLHGVLKTHFPDEARKQTPDSLWKMVNKVTPSLIRVEADEVTYSLHVIIRMLLEERMFAGDLEVKDLPDAWNELYQRYLGITPKDYKDGVMQDVHWYNGIIAYFPTYALGNLYSAMMLESAERALPTLWKDVEAGHLLPLLGWLRTNVHELGMTYRGPDLIRKITGKSLDESAFLNYLRRKFKVT